MSQTQYKGIGADSLVDQIKKMKGAFYIPMLLPNDVIYVQCVKIDLIWQFENVSCSDKVEWTVNETGHGNWQIDFSE